MVVILAYDIFIANFTATNASGVLSELKYYGPAFTAFLLALNTLSGGIVVMKSDRDYLFTLPLDKRSLALSLYITQFIATGIVILLGFGFFFASYMYVVAGAYDRLLLVLDMVGLALAISSLGVISNVLSTYWRILTALLLAVWALSAILGVPFTPASFFTGNILSGSAAMLSMTVIFTGVALSELSHVELGTMRSLIRVTSAEVKNIRSFAGMSPARAIFSQNFLVFQFAASLNMGGASRYQSGNVRISRVLPVTVALALIYGYLALNAPVLMPPGGPVLGNSVATVLPTFVLFIVFFSSQGGMANERAWLALTAMEPALYFRYLLIAKVLSFVVAISPFAAVNIALAFLGVGGMLTPVIPLLVYRLTKT